MQKRHDDLLTQRIDEVVNRGVTYIAWWELNFWYDAKRISKNIWRDLRERFMEAASDDNAVSGCMSCPKVSPSFIQTA